MKSLIIAAILMATPLLATAQSPMFQHVLDPDKPFTRATPEQLNKVQEQFKSTEDLRSGQSGAPTFYVEEDGTIRFNHILAGGSISSADDTVFLQGAEGELLIPIISKGQEKRLPNGETVNAEGSYTVIKPGEFTGKTYYIYTHPFTGQWCESTLQYGAPTRCWNK